MKILGVQENTIIWAWYITYTIIFFIGCILQALASKAGLFENSDPIIIFFFFFLFGLSVLAYGFLVSTWFSRSRTGAFAGMVVFFFMYFVSAGFSSSSSKASKTIACFLSPVALSFGVQSLANVEATGVGMHRGNARTVADNFSFDISLAMMLIDTILYTLLGLYFERVIPKEYGTTEKWYFPVSPSYWRKKASPKVKDSTSPQEAIININPNVEPVGSELQQQERNGEALVIHNIKKEFVVPGGIKKAVRGVSLVMYKDQITCLLGHNGAGKTTLISMLTGVIAPTDGDAYFRGYSLNRNMREIRQSLGLCFQHDVLYADLTVEEHLIFFARVKGYKGKEVADVVSTKIREALMDQTIYRFMAADGDPNANADVTLKVNTFPLPYTATTKALFGSFLSFTACLFIVIAFAFYPASIVVFLVKEKQPEHNSKHQQLVSGVSLPAFWLANYIWDLLTYSIPFFAAIIMIQAFDISAFTGNGCSVCTSETYPAVVLMFILFGFAISPFTYVMSYFFRDHASSQTYTIMANFVLGVVLMVVSFVLDVISESSKDANKVLKYFWRLSPLYCLGSGLLNQSIKEITANFGFSSTKPSPFDMDLMGWEMLYLAFDAAFFFVVAVGIDFLMSFPKIRAAVFKDPQIKDAPYEEDEDVRLEAERVAKGGADNDAVVVKNLRKVYKGNKVAVRNLSFGLPKGECFGYLGINGAGKTTTMKMMTGDILPTSGVGKLGGFDILSQQLEVRRLIGYCPQFDALFELLSVREHLELFARIKGVPSRDLEQVVKDLMHQMNLDDFENKLAGTLSGGNKRKLSVAIAMIGSPPIIFLDEPSTGMDPVSRRFMWNVIANISTQKKESTIILTTHSMEECEALCTRVGIMVGGRLRCLGSVQHLKNRHGDGLMMEVKLDAPSSSEIEARMQAVLGGSTSTISKDQLRGTAEKFGNAAWVDKIDAKHATGYALATALERDGSIRPQLFCAWWMGEERFLKLDAFLQQCFGSGHAKILERQNEMCRYKLVGDAQMLRLSNVFRLVESGKTEHHIREYAVSQTTLEQIFNNFAAQQNEEKGVARGLAN
ncbi:hypothetical protein P43SY_005207 [Pythium insidiosum]|uniref:ABC transporter domain-containing protein n=1 Tax=Pythium insidiosum TaxID=114742 RepID=A0AAD5LNC6_PYTIN|nr:hypothetical protein P43SY_005207 [Pythium insidiosum]